MAGMELLKRFSDDLDTIEDRAEARAEDKYDGNTRIGRAKQVATVLAAVTIGVVALIGIYIYDQVFTTMPSPENSNLNNSTTQVTEGFGSAMEFVPVVLIVLMSAVVIGIVQRLRG